MQGKSYIKYLVLFLNVISPCCILTSPFSDLRSGIYPFVEAENMQTTSLPTFNFRSANILNQSFKVWKGTVNYYLKVNWWTLLLLYLWSSALDGNSLYSESDEEEQWLAWAGPMLTFATNIWSFNFSGKMSENTIKWRKPWVTTNSLLKKNWKFKQPKTWLTLKSVPIQQSLKAILGEVLLESRAGGAISDQLHLIRIWMLEQNIPLQLYSKCRFPFVLIIRTMIIRWSFIKDYLRIYLLYPTKTKLTFRASECNYAQLRNMASMLSAHNVFIACFMSPILKCSQGIVDNIMPHVPLISPCSSR